MFSFDVRSVIGTSFLNKHVIRSACRKPVRDSQRFKTSNFLTLHYILLDSKEVKYTIQIAWQLVDI